jgi:uncharacterized protein YqgC (DUF456 family)
LIVLSYLSYLIQGAFVDILVFSSCFLLAVLGILLTVINFPGAWTVALATLLYGLWNDFISFTVFQVVIFFILALASTFIDQLAMIMGAKRLGASKWGMLGAVVGGLVGIFFGLIGLVVAPFVGAVIGESCFARKELSNAFKAGFGVFIGFVFGVGLKFGIAVGMTIYWVLKVFSH